MEAVAWPVMVPELVNVVPAVAVPVIRPKLVRLPEASTVPATVVIVPRLVKFPVGLRSSVSPLPLTVTPPPTVAPSVPASSRLDVGDAKLLATIRVPVVARRSVAAVTCVWRFAPFSTVLPPAPILRSPEVRRLRITVPVGPALSAAAMVMASAVTVMVWPRAVTVPPAV